MPEKKKKRERERIKVVEDLALGGEKKNPWFMAQHSEGAKGIYSPISVSPS